MIRTPLWEYIVKSNSHGMDILSLPEQHKYRQSGLGILRKRLRWESHRDAPFQEEMLAVGQAPIRFSVTGLHSESDREQTLSKSNLKLLKNADARSVLYAIGLGAFNVEKIMGQANLAESTVLKMLAKLLSAKIIQYKDGMYSEDPSFWKNLSPDESSGMYHEMNDACLENPNVLDLIVGQLSPHKEYSEAYISRYCSFFTDDFARLRRKLVDDGRLLKNGNTYMVRKGITSRL